MRTVADLATTDPALRGAAAAIGNFDGVHLGHRAVIDIARAAAGRLGAPLGVVTFEPHPRAVFAPDAPPFRLTDAATRARRLERLGVDVLYQLPFDRALASLSPDAFVGTVLAEGLGLCHVVVGDDFRFGAQRTGTAAVLADLGHASGIGVTIADAVAVGAEEVSSTRIRAALSEGRPRDAAAMLGHLHRIEGEVVHGEKRGRELGYPTANMSIHGLHPPAFGIYAVRADVLDGPYAGPHVGVASLGVRPMFGGSVPNLETFLLDFSGDLYGARMSVALVDYIRPEATFDGLPALIARMDADTMRAREILADGREAAR